MPNKTSIAARACRIVQLYARLRDTDRNGYGYCRSCNKLVHFSSSDGGHFQPKGRHYNAACIDPRNVNLQCKLCNGFLGGNPAGYAEWMVEEYGLGILEELFLLSKKTNNKTDMIKAVDEYRAKNRELAKTKMFEVRLK